MTLLKGTIHGRTIELQHEPGLPEGQEVSVILTPLPSSEETIRRTAGGWADDAEGLDAFVRQMRHDRELDRQEPAS